MDNASKDLYWEGRGPWFTALLWSWRGCILPAFSQPAPGWSCVAGIRSTGHRAERKERGPWQAVRKDRACFHPNITVACCHMTLVNLVNISALSENHIVLIWNGHIKSVAIIIIILENNDYTNKHFKAQTFNIISVYGGVRMCVGVAGGRVRRRLVNQFVMSSCTFLRHK